MSPFNFAVRSDALTLGAYWLRAILALATLFSVECAGTKMASTSPSSPTPTASLSPSNSALKFASVQLGSAKSMSLALTNAGTSAAVQISQVTASGPGFTVIGVTLPVNLAVGQSVTLSVDFEPTSAGSTSGNLSIASTATNANISVGLSGAGLASGQLAVSPASMNFSSVTVGGSQNQTGILTAGSSSITSRAQVGMEPGFRSVASLSRYKSRPTERVIHRQLRTPNSRSCKWRSFFPEQCEQLADQRNLEWDRRTSSPAQRRPDLEPGYFNRPGLLRVSRRTDRRALRKNLHPTTWSFVHRYQRVVWSGLLLRCDSARHQFARQHVLE
jgi:Abnormal spindle-like microcephaly-assoc'd, ASPM-SPD-2-Hydin